MISSKLVGISRVMAVLAAIGAVIQPIMVAYIFLDPGRSQWLMFDVDHLGGDLNVGVPLTYRLIALACALLPTAFDVWALWALSKLFLLISRPRPAAASASPRS